MALVAPSDPVEAMKSILTAADAGADHFALLQLPRTATNAEVRDQYFRLAKIVHPDLPYFMAKPELRQQAGRAFQLITQAHAALGDAEKRQNYLTGMATKAAEKESVTTGAPVKRTLDPPPNAEVARIYVHRGKQQITRRDFVGAQEALEAAALVLQGKELADCKVALGWAMFNNNANPEKERIEKPRTLWVEACGLGAKTASEAQASYYLACWHKLHGEQRHMGPLLAKCLEIQPNNIEAAREKRLLDKRRASGAEIEDMLAATKKPSKSAIPESPAARASSSANKKITIDKPLTLLERLFGKK